RTSCLQPSVSRQTTNVKIAIPILLNSSFRGVLKHLQLGGCQNWTLTLCSRIDVSDYYYKLYENAEIIICLHDGKLVGLIAFYCNDIKTRTAYVTFIAVLSAYRGHKIASLLLEKASKVSSENEMYKIKIDTNNEVAYRCYLRNDFKLIETTFLPEYNLNRYFLEKEI
ncbi:MAG: GNAT family N-acetyltransferase, partial [Bacteroidaceae bacterium]|nr:GNAT family N-acetyltransferase [Bacteroidaceae bacterium]